MAQEAAGPCWKTQGNMDAAGRCAGAWFGSSSVSGIVRAKSGLNKAILDQGWAEFRRQLAYKMQWSGGELIAVDPRNTSRTCPECWHVDEGRQGFM